MASTRRRRGLWALAAAGVVVIVVLSALLVVALLRPAPAEVSGTPAPTPTPAATPTPSPEAATSQQEHREYRTYVSTVIQGSVAVIASLGGLVGCRNSRSDCVDRVHDASTEVANMQDDLASNPAPSCLTDADAKLRDALTFQENGLAAAQTGIEQQNRVKLAQGVIMTAVGVWRAGQAIVEGRQAEC